MSKVKWLHFSDLHMNVDGVETKLMRDGLLAYLEDKKFRCDYVFISGDLRNAPDGAFPKNTASYLKNVVEIVGTTVEKTFIVPGNHDIIRDNADRMEAIKRMYFNEEKTGYYRSSDGKIRADDLYAISRGKDDFVEVMKEFYGEDSERVSYYCDALHPHFLIDTDEFNVIHVDSTISYAKGQERELILGADLVYELAEMRNNEKTTVVLTHYSFDFLTRDEQELLLKILGDEKNFLWIAGHEHRQLVREQRGTFFELQAGNLIKEQETKSCFLFGELDTVSGAGSVKGYCWFSPEGWAEYPIMNMKTGSNEYLFSLWKNVENSQMLKTIVEESVGKLSVEKIYRVNLNKLDENILKDVDTAGLEDIKRQLGNRLKGTESNSEVISMFLAEVQISLNSGKRYECMPMFQNVVRGVYDGYINIDNEFAPIDKVKIVHFYFDLYDKFCVFGAKYWFEIVTIQGVPVSIAEGYDLSTMQDVEERLYEYRKIEKFAKAKRMFVKMIGNEQQNLSLDCEQLLKFSDEWRRNIEITDFWIDKMQKIKKIQSWFGIQFRLPRRMDDGELFAIQILSDAIDRRFCCILPGIPGEVLLRKRFEVKEEIEVDIVDCLSELRLLGYIFTPVKSYLTPEQYKWNKSKKVWETKYGGITIGVEFEAEIFK